MFLDASAIVAILLEEPEADQFIDKIAATLSPILLSPLVRYEVVMALARAHGTDAQISAPAIDAATRALDAFLAEIETDELAISSEIGAKAITAQQRYGKLVGHPARLNFGDCFAYACAKAKNVPLLYKGDDFTHTDLGGVIT